MVEAEAEVAQIVHTQELREHQTYSVIHLPAAHVVVTVEAA
jgi:hypothetical protein